MISAFRTGQVAGSVLFHEHPHYMLDEQRQAALSALETRKKLGVAHCTSEEEFIQGFLHGYQHPICSSDGLALFVALH